MLRLSQRWLLSAMTVILCTACAVPLPPALPDPTTTFVSATPTPEFEFIHLPVSFYILDDTEGVFSSSRTEEELEAIVALSNDIWAQASIGFDVQAIHRVAVQTADLQALAEGDLQPFFQSAGTSLSMPEPSLINGFYAQNIGGPNGLTPLSSRTFFVMDTPSVHDERVTSHEIGHILGLHHTLSDPGRLLYPGTNGMMLTDSEILVARYVAQGMLEGVR